MRVAVLADIHGNWIALERVLADLAGQQIDLIIGLGDYLNTSLGSARVVDWLRSQPAGGAYFIRGNSDAWRYYDRFRDASKQDAADQYHFVNRLPDRLVLDLGGLRVLVQHQVPGLLLREIGFTEENVRYVMSRAYIETVMDLRGIDIALFGDLHKQQLDMHEDLVIVYPGSVGATWPAGYALLDLDLPDGPESPGGMDGAGPPPWTDAPPAVHITYRRVVYDRAAAVQDMRAAYREDPGDRTWLERQLYRDRFNAYSDWVTPFARVSWRKPPTTAGKP